MPDKTLPPYFQLFNEIGILEQLSRTMFEAKLPDGVLVSHFSVLNHLARLGDGKTPLELARAFQVAKTTMTHTLGGLEKRGWIEMKPNPKDGRSKCVFLTPEGRGFRDEAIALLADDLSDVADVFDAHWLDATLPRLQALRAWMDDRR